MESLGSPVFSLVVLAIVAVLVAIQSFAFSQKYKPRRDAGDDDAAFTRADQEMASVEQGIGFPYYYHQDWQPNAPTYDGHATAPTWSSAGGSGSRTLQTIRRQRGGDVNELVQDPEILAAKMPLSSIVQEERVGRGAYGEVFRGQMDGRVVAIKRLLPETRKKPHHIQNFLAEVRLVVRMEHPNLVELLGVAWDSLINLCAVYEFMAGGDLKTLLEEYRRTDMPRGFDRHKLSIGFDIANALVYIHSLVPKVLHRDLKSRNVLLDEHHRAKLTDFGVSREANEQTMTAGIGTHLWMAPEVMMGKKYNERADVFSFGIVLSELDTHELPYGRELNEPAANGRRLPETAVLQLVAMGQIQAEFFTPPEDAMVQLARWCLQLNPLDRPTAAQVSFELHKALRRLSPEE